MRGGAQCKARCKVDVCHRAKTRRGPAAAPRGRATGPRRFGPVIGSRRACQHGRDKVAATEILQCNNERAGLRGDRHRPSHCHCHLPSCIDAGASGSRRPGDRPAACAARGTVRRAGGVKTPSSAERRDVRRQRSGPWGIPWVRSTLGLAPPRPPRVGWVPRAHPLASSTLRLPFAVRSRRTPAAAGI